MCKMLEYDMCSLIVRLTIIIIIINKNKLTLNKSLGFRVTNLIVTSTNNKFIARKNEKKNFYSF